jgi:peptidylprolyl isomerase
MRIVNIALQGACVAWISGMAGAAGVLGTAGTVQTDATQVKALVAELSEATRSAVATDLGALEQLVRADLLNRAVMAEAESTDFGRRPETVAALGRVRAEALARLWIAERTRLPQGYPTDAEVAAAYAEVKSGLLSPAEHHLAQIFVRAPDAADPATLAKALRKVTDLAPKLAAPAADFGKLARENSEQAESAAKGGDMGWLAEDTILPEVRGAVQTLKAGGIAGPIKTAQGFHFVRLIETRAPRALTLEESRPRLVAALRNQRSAELQQKYLQELQAKLAVRVDQVGLAALQKELR